MTSDKTMVEQNEKCKIIVMAIIVGFCCALTYYFHAILETDKVFTHFCYVPIILACMWWKRKGLVVAIFLAALIIFSQIFVCVAPVTADVYLRALMFVVIGVVVATLSERIAKAWARIRKEKKSSDNIITTVPDSLLVVDRDLRIKKANLAFYTVFQMEPETVIGTRITEIIGDEDGKLSTELTKLFETEDMLESFEMHYQPEKSDEQIFNIKAKGINIAEEEEEEEVVVVLSDITEQKRVEEALREFSEEMELKVGERTEELQKEHDYVRHLIESSPDFQLTLDKEGTILDVNAAFEQFIGKNRKDLISSAIYKYIEREKIEQLVTEIANKEKIRNSELTVNIAGKGTLILNISGTIFTTEKGEEGFYLTGRDLTEAKAKETQLIHAGRLSSLGEMASGMAHEINQPLAIISLAAEGLLRDVEKKRMDISRFPEDIEDILKSVKRIDTIITHMRAFSRKREEIIVIKPETVLNNVFILLGTQLKMHNISVSYNIADNLPAAMVDPNQLEQVFVNILTNARQVLDERGEKAKEEGVHFEKQLVCGISRERENGKEWVVYEFADNGYGVPDESKTRVFEPFFTTKEAGEGTGLGLSIAYRVLTQMLNGRIWVEDNDMGGASFKVALPVADKINTRKGG